LAAPLAASSFERAATMLGAAARPRPTPDRRRFRRTALTLAGRVLHARGLERDCRTLDISPGGARLMAPEMPAPGDQIVLYLDEIGRVPAEVMRASPEDGFGVLFQATIHKREKIAEQMIWLLNKNRFGLEEERREPRYASSNAISVTLEDGRALHCDVLDFSLVGASLRTAQKRPEIGAWVRVGQTYGRVSRYLPEGFAVDFQTIPTQRS
jgi:hypothetical protein